MTQCMKHIILRVDDEEFEALQALKRHGESWEKMFLRVCLKVVKMDDD